MAEFEICSFSNCKLCYWYSNITSL